jgi:hypothetical protein
LRRWLREFETLGDVEEVVHAYEPEIGRNLSDEKEVRSMRDLIGCKVGRSKLLAFQVGNEMRSVDLINKQEGRGGIQYCYMVKGGEMNSAESSYQ